MLIQINRDRVMNGTDCILFVDSYRLIARTTESSVFRKTDLAGRVVTIGCICQGFNSVRGSLTTIPSGRRSLGNVTSKCDLGQIVVDGAQRTCAWVRRTLY